MYTLRRTYGWQVIPVLLWHSFKPKSTCGFKRIWLWVSVALLLLVWCWHLGISDFVSWGGWIDSLCLYQSLLWPSFLSIHCQAWLLEVFVAFCGMKVSFAPVKSCFLCDWYHPWLLRYQPGPCLAHKPFLLRVHRLKRSCVSYIFLVLSGWSLKVPFWELQSPNLAFS